MSFSKDLLIWDGSFLGTIEKRFFETKTFNTVNKKIFNQQTNEMEKVTKKHFDSDEDYKNFNKIKNYNICMLTTEDNSSIICNYRLNKDDTLQFIDEFKEIFGIDTHTSNIDERNKLIRYYLYMHFQYSVKDIDIDKIHDIKKIFAFKYIIGTTLANESSIKVYDDIVLSIKDNKIQIKGKLSKKILKKYFSDELINYIKKEFRVLKDENLDQKLDSLIRRIDINKMELKDIILEKIYNITNL